MKRYLILSDGSVFEGRAMGAEGETLGEVVRSEEHTSELQSH